MNTQRPKTKSQPIKRFKSEETDKMTAVEDEPFSNSPNHLDNFTTNQNYLTSGNQQQLQATKSSVAFDFHNHNHHQHHSDQISECNTTTTTATSDNLILDLEFDQVGDYYVQDEASFVHYEYNIS